MAETIIDRLYRDFKDLISYLDKESEISFRSTIDVNFKKVLLLAAASYFERRICDDLVEYFNDASSKNQLVTEFVKNKAISRQYHTFFKWESNNANQFFALFGDTFKAFMIGQMRSDEPLNTAVKAFLEIGSERNRLVHQDFGSISLEKTADEIYQLYSAALPFVNSFPDKLRVYTRQGDSSEIPKQA